MMGARKKFIILISILMIAIMGFLLAEIYISEGFIILVFIPQFIIGIWISLLKCPNCGTRPSYRLTRFLGIEVRAWTSIPKKCPKCGVKL